ncbi:VPS10 domain-containing protein [Sunxiuqinia sp. A32]|uniref:VPS10 domain-containing protein n=1 Tax=Sunxiuqinia sp. A32 TaxID=3461496 RepID=UPI0040451A9F
MKKAALLLALVLLSSSFSWAKKKDKDTEQTKGDTIITSSLVSGLKFRSIGPAWASGRIADFAVNPKNPKEFYVGVASGNVWKTSNNGTTWQPVFDKYGSYAIGDVELDPNNPNIVWVGTGENNHQRALGYGDGIYKSLDGGKSFKNMGLKESFQIGGIVIDPRNSDIVYVACEGSAWGPGGERGLYKTIDGGKTWERILEISENTGVNNIKMDPKNPDILYATSEQRRRTSFTKIGGGPESSVYKSTDAGANWRKITEGLPKVDIGGMGIDVSPVDPNVLYLIVEAAEGKGGFFRSTNQGESWNKMSDYSASGQYYNEIYCDPKDVDKVYSVETFSAFTLDAGKTWKRISTKGRHVDDHAIWIDPKDTEHFMIGGDGGIYETWDCGNTFDFKENLPITQFYRVHVDNEKPFYNVYGGTQDNNSMFGPSQNTCSDGVINDEWEITLGGDGFWLATDPDDPNIVYTEYQYGNLYRYDKKSGERLNIKPREKKGEETYKWNWNAPMIVSPHNGKRLYSAANKVFKSDDQGSTWEIISDDLTSQTDRNNFPVMGKYWPADAVVKDVSTSLWGTLVSLDESPVKEGLLYAGSDDGVISISENGGNSWQLVKSFPEVPQYTYVSDLCADKFDENTVYASFDNLKRNDFKPYIYKSTDKGKTWTSISGNLPENGTVYTIVQDFKRPELLFAGTEFGVFFTIDDGKNWVQLKAGLPTIAVRDITIQEDESDLVLATFGRGFYILNDYSPLRELSHELTNEDAHIFAIEDALMYIQKGSKNNQGSTYFKSKNPDYGATFTYYLKDTPKSKKDLRKEKEKELFKAGKPIPQPTWRELELESQQENSHLIFSIEDEEGNVINQLTAKPSKGINRITWNLRYANSSSVRIKDKFNPISDKRGSGILAMPGKYKVGLKLWHEGELTELVKPVEFTCKKLNNASLPATDYSENVDFAKKLSKLSVAVVGCNNLLRELGSKIEYIKEAIYATANANQDLMDRARKLAVQIDELNYQMNGDKAKASGEEIPPAQVPLSNRLNFIAYNHMGSTSGITTTEKENFEILSAEFSPVLKQLKQLVEQDIPAIEAELNALNAPWTPGRLPEWNE